MITTLKHRRLEVTYEELVRNAIEYYQSDKDRQYI